MDVTDFERRHEIQRDGWPFWYLIGPEGAVQFAAMAMPGETPVMPGLGVVVDRVQLMGIDIGYHSPTPRREGQEPMNPCPVHGDVLCYYSGTSLEADGLLKMWAEAGCNHEVVWTSLEMRYKAWFEDAEGELFVSPLEAIIDAFRRRESED